MASMAGGVVFTMTEAAVVGLLLSPDLLEATVVASGGVGGGGGGGDGGAHEGPEILLLSNTTWPVCAITRPLRDAPLLRFISVRARIFPKNDVVVSRVAELPILHHTLQASPPVIDEPGDVMRVDTVLNIQTPVPVRLRLPLNEKLDVEQ